MSNTTQGKLFGESSPRATVALDGNIIRRGDNLQ
jgi:hypothetical protein